MSTSFDRAPGRRLTRAAPVDGPPPTPAPPPARGAYPPDDPGLRPGRPRFDGWLGRPERPGSPRGSAPRRRWPVLVLAVALTGAAAVAALVVLGGDEAEGGYAFGTVATPAGALVRTSADGESRPLDSGETVLEGWTVEAANEPVTLELDGGGVVRFDAGARVTFRGGAHPGATDRRPRPLIAVRGGRMWFNPGGRDGSTDVVVSTRTLSVTSGGNPIGVDCADDCLVEAPAGGVEATTDDGLALAPAAGELVVDADGVGVRAAAGPSEWATQNLAADTAAGLPPPAPTEGPGVAAGALPALSYAIEVEVTSTATGDALAPGLSWGPGEQHTLDASVDTPACYSLPCSVRISSFDDPDTAAVRVDRAGVVRVGDGRMAVTLERQVGCLDAAGNVARVVGSSTIAADLAVLEATHDPVTGRWNATTLEGSGTASVTITDPTCATGASPTGTRTNDLRITATAT